MSSSKHTIPPVSQPSRLPRPATAGAISALPSLGHTHNDAHTTPRRQHQQSAVDDAISQPNIPPTSQPSKLPRPATASSPPSTAHPHNDAHTTSPRQYQQPAVNGATSQPSQIPKRTRSSPPSTAHSHNDAHTRPRRQSMNDGVRDEPFLSHELFKGMLKGQPDNAHVGSMYTAAQEREYDEYYERVTGRRPWAMLEELMKSDIMKSSDDAFVGARIRDDAQYGRCFGNWW